MSWAAKRETKRIEDTAYCLLGIFNVNMPLLYGEGIKAFRRLQEEIIKRHNDLTIFVWMYPQAEDKTSSILFAESPAAFENSSRITPFRDDCEDFSITNKGLHVSGEAPLREISLRTKQGCRISLYALWVGFLVGDGERLARGIYLRKIGPKLFVRDFTSPLAGFFDPDHYQGKLLDDMTDYYILSDPKPNISPLSFRGGALHMGTYSPLELEDAVPETLWDITDQVFLKPKPYGWARYPMVIATRFRGPLLGENIDLVVLCRFKEGYLFPNCKLFWGGSYPQEEMIIFQHRRNRRESVYWSQFEIDAPHILELSNKVERRVGRRVLSISAWFQKEIVPEVTSKMEMFSLKLEIVVNSDPGIEFA
jgi:hypothetical protein